MTAGVHVVHAASTSRPRCVHVFFVKNQDYVHTSTLQRVFFRARARARENTLFSCGRVDVWTPEGQR